MAAEARNFLLTLSGSGLRSAMYEGKSHLVVPVVMMVEGVVWAVNSPAPELVEEDELIKAFKGWNGRPVMGEHPQRDGQMISANEPSVLEQHAFGIVFNAYVKNKKLAGEAWIDALKAGKTEVGRAVLERLNNGKMVEISVGAFIQIEHVAGDFNGQKYEGRWTEIVPDHLAFLPNDIGACSIEAGCGAPRTAAHHHRLTEQGIEIMAETAATGDAPKTPVVVPTWKERIAALLKFRSNKTEEVSVNELWGALGDALRAVEPGYLGIEDVILGASQVIYAVDPGTFGIFMRDYTMADGTVSLGKGKTEVQPVRVWEPVAAQGAPATPRGACGCGASTSTQVTAAEGDTKMAKAKKEIVDGLIANTATPWVETDRSFLEGLDDARLTAFEAQVKPAATTETAQPVAQPAAAAAATTQPVAQTTQTVVALTTEQYIAQAPVELQETLREGLRASQAARTKAVTSLKDSKRCAFTDAELAAMPMEHLNRMVTLLGAPARTGPTVVDFSTRNTTAAAAGSEEETGAPEPIDLAGNIRAAALAAKK